MMPSKESNSRFAPPVGGIRVHLRVRVLITQSDSGPRAETASVFP
jgi:hypothetical protein